MRIAVIQTAFLGDVVLTTPFLVALFQRWPNAEIHFITTPEGSQVLQGLPRVVVHVLDKKNKKRFQGIAEVMNRIRGTRFDLVFCVHRSARSLFLARRIDAKRRIAFRSWIAALLGFETHRYPDYSNDTHYSDKPLELLRLFDLDKNQPTPKPWLKFNEKSLERFRSEYSLPQKASYIVLCPFAMWGTKMWPADKYAELAQKLFNKFNLPIVLLGTGNSQVSDKITTYLHHGGAKTINLIGQTNIEEMKALIANAALLVSNDSAPVHIASAFNIPTVAIFGPTVKKWGFFPLASQSVVVERANLECRPCHIHGPMVCPLEHFRCMNEIKVEDVEKAIQTLGVCRQPEVR